MHDWLSVSRVEPYASTFIFLDERDSLIYRRGATRAITRRVLSFSRVCGEGISVGLVGFRDSLYIFSKGTRRRDSHEFFCFFFFLFSRILAQMKLER